MMMYSSSIILENRLVYRKSGESFPSMFVYVGFRGSDLGFRLARESEPFHLCLHIHTHVHQHTYTHKHTHTHTQVSGSDIETERTSLGKKDALEEGEQGTKSQNRNLKKTKNHS
jgi:hypothetical protein